MIKGNTWEYLDSLSLHHLLKAGVSKLFSIKDQSKYFKLYRLHVVSVVGSSFFLHNPSKM